MIRFQPQTQLLRVANLEFICRRRPWLKSSTFIRAFSSSNYTNQSRGGLPRFFSDVLPTSQGEVVRVQGDEFWHITKVLRLGVDDRVELFNGKGGLVEGSIERIDRSGLEIVACEDPILVHSCGIQWHVYAAFGIFGGTTHFVFLWSCSRDTYDDFAPVIPRYVEGWSSRLAC